MKESQYAETLKQNGSNEFFEANMKPGEVNIKEDWRYLEANSKSIES